MVGELDGGGKHLRDLYEDLIFCGFLRIIVQWTITFYILGESFAA